MNMRKITLLLAVMAVFGVGNVYAVSTPTTQVTGLTVGTINPQSVALTWTAGNGTKTLIVYSKNNSFSSNLPSNNKTYVSGSGIPSSSVIPTGYLVGFAGTGTSATISGLTAGTTYYFAAYTYNDGTTTLLFPSNTELYFTISAPQTSATTGTYTRTTTSIAAGTWETVGTWSTGVIPLSTDGATVTATYPVTITGITTPTITPTGFYLQSGSSLLLKPNNASTYTVIDYLKNVTIDGNGGSITLKPATEAAAKNYTVTYSPTITNVSSVDLRLNVAGRVYNSSSQWSTGYTIGVPYGIQLNIINDLASPSSTPVGFPVYGDATYADTKLNLGDYVRMTKYYNQGSSSGTSYHNILIGELSGNQYATIEGGITSSSSRSLYYEIGRLNTDATFNGTFKNYTTSPLCVFKKGTGTWTLTGDSHSGFTQGLFNIDAGTVALSATGRLGSTAVPVTVASGATLKGTYGATVDGATAVNGTLTGSIAFNSNLTLSGTPTTNLTVNGYSTAGTDYNYINAAGLTVTNAGTLNITINSLPSGNTSIKLINAGTYTSSFSTVNIKDGSGNTPVGFSYNSTNGTLTYSLAAPTIQSTSLTLSSVLQTTLNSSWTLGDGTKNLVLYSTNSDVATAYPPQDNTTYTLGSTTHAGYIVGGISTGNTASITGLSPNTQYYFAVFGFNDYNTTGMERYMRTSPATANATTPASSLASDYFQSRVSGTWTTATTWNSSSDNSSWHLSDLVPVSTASGVLIGAGNTVTVSSSPSAASTGLTIADASTLSIVTSGLTIPATTFTGTTATIDGSTYYGTKVSGLSVSNGNKATLKGSYNTSNANITGTFDATGTLASGSELILNGTGTENKFGMTSANTTFLANTKVTLKGYSFLYIDANQGGATTINIGTLAGESTSKLGWGKSIDLARNITWSVGASNENSEYAGTITNTGGYAGSSAMYIGNFTHFIKAGTGTLTFSGTANTHNGNFTVNAGTLNVTGVICKSTSTVTVASIATLTGTGSVGGAATINGTLSGTVAIAGAATIGSAGTLAGSHTFGSTLSLAGTTNLTVTSASTFDHETITGAVTFGGVLNVTVTATDISVGSSVQLFNATGGYSGSFGLVNCPGYSFDAATGLLTRLAIAPTVSYVAIDDAMDNQTFNVSSTGLTSDITVTAPIGITVSPTTITANASNVPVTVTFTDKTSAINGNIVFTSDASTTNVILKATKNSTLFTKVYAAPTNLVTEPYMNSLSAYSSSWGVGTGAFLTTDFTKVYCGSSCGVITGTNAGSITYPLSGVWAANTTYRIKAKVNVISGQFNLNVSGWNGAVADITNVINVTSGWQDIDFSFTTGATLGATQYFYFNNFGLGFGTGYIDNVQMYAVPASTLTGNGNWSDATKWTDVPVTGSDVIIPVGSSLNIDQSATLKSLTVAPGSKVTLNSGKTLTAPVTLQSDATNGTATFVDAGVTGSTITATVQQYLPTGRNWYVGVPFIDASATGASALTGAGASSVSYWDEPTGAWVNSYSGALSRGRGYIAVSASGSSANNISFTGTLNTGSVPVTVTRTVGVTKEGFNLIANPYPSYLNAMTAINASAKMEPTIWYRTKGTSYEFETVNTASGVGTNVSLTGQVTGYVPPMQAFWVRVLPNANPLLGNSETLTFTNAMRYHAGSVVTDAGNVPTTVMKAPSATKSLSSVLRLQVSNGTNTDEAIIYTNANAVNGYDAYDSEKMTNGNAAIPEIYSVVGSENLVINGLNSIQPNMEIPLGFTTKQTNTFTIKASEISNFDGGTSIMLYDNKLNKQQELTTTNAYSFSSDSVVTTSRFSIIFKTTSVATGINTTGNNQAVEVYKNANNQIVINCSRAGIDAVTVSVFNAIGQKLESKTITGTTTVTNSYAAGVYVISVLTNGKTTTQKVVLN